VVARWYVYFHTQNPNFGKFWKVLLLQMLVFVIAILSSLRPNGKFCGYLVYLVYFSRFGIFGTEKNLATLIAGTVL
jgi:hypothetical protein